MPGKKQRARSRKKVESKEAAARKPKRRSARPTPPVSRPTAGAPLTPKARSAIERAFESEGLELLPEQDILIQNPAKKRNTRKGTFTGNEAFLPPQSPLPKGFHEIGGIPVKRTRRELVWPDLDRYRLRTVLYPWLQRDWLLWRDIVGTLNPCRSVPAKTGVVKIATHAKTNMCRVSKDCTLVYTVADDGIGNVVNVITESVDATFTVATNPSPSPAHPGAIAPLVHPFTKGGINHKYKRLYVPASFYSTARVMENGGFYVAVVDIDPTSTTYLDTIDWIDCGWIPEEVSFSGDEEIGVIANYMQGTATFFNASNGQLIGARERDGFTGAVSDPGEAYARSVRCGNVPGVGNRAFMTLTDKTPSPGIAVFDLDDAPNFGRTNISLSGFVDGVALTPDNRRLLALTSTHLLVVRVDVLAPFVERTIPLPTDASQSYFGGITVRPTGDLAFLATGSANSTSSTQGTSLVQVNWTTGTTLQIPGGLASQTWGLEIHGFGSNLKPHIFVCSRSGELAIIPC